MTRAAGPATPGDVLPALWENWPTGQVSPGECDRGFERNRGAATAGDSRAHDAGAAKRGYGQLAGWATLIACVLAVPSSLLLEPLPDPIDYLPTVLGAIIGVILIRFPWERHSVSAFHLVGIVAALDIALAVRTFTPLYAYFYFLVAIYIAYVYADWNQVVPHLLFLSLLTCLPIIHSPETTREGLRIALFAIPVLWMAAGIVSYLAKRARAAAAHLPPARGRDG